MRTPLEFGTSLLLGNVTKNLNSPEVIGDVDATLERADGPLNIIVGTLDVMNVLRSTGASEVPTETVIHGGRRDGERISALDDTSYLSIHVSRGDADTSLSGTEGTAFVADQRGGTVYRASTTAPDQVGLYRLPKIEGLKVAARATRAVRAHRRQARAATAK